MQKTLAMRIIFAGEDALALWLHTQVDPDPAEWNEAVARLAAYKAERTGDYSKLRGLVLSDGASPDLAQRKQLFTDLVPNHPLAVLTTVMSNPIKRGVATAIGWLNPRFCVLRPEEVDKAIKHIGWSGDAAGLWPTIRELHKSSGLPRIECLSLIAKAKGFSFAE